MTYMYFLIGLCLLVFGADLLVASASRLAAAFKISPLVVGLTVVAFGTSAPEMAVSIQAAISGQDNIVIGNVIGSNIFNVLFILGLTAIICPLVVSSQLIKLEVPLLIILSFILYMFGIGGVISQFEGAMLFLGLIIYTSVIIYKSKKENQELSEEGDHRVNKHFWIKNISLTILGLGLLVFGSDLLINNVIIIARNFNVSEEVIGLTVVAAGTSMPELVTSIMAAFRGKVDVAVGNILGSNIFNILGVTGLASLINANGCKVSNAIETFDLPVMIAVSIICLPIFITEKTISRLEGITLFIFYCAYSVYLVLVSRGVTGDVDKFKATMVYIVIPLILVFFVICRKLKHKEKLLE